MKDRRVGIQAIVPSNLRKQIPEKKERTPKLPSDAENNSERKIPVCIPYIVVKRTDQNMWGPALSVTGLSLQNRDKSGNFRSELTGVREMPAYKVSWLLLTH